MQDSYSQFNALWAITKASLKATLKNPGSLFFSLMFPLIFVMIFGAFSNGSMKKFKLAVSQKSDTTNLFYQTLRSLPFITLKKYDDTVLQRKDLEQGDLTGIITITDVKDSAKIKPHYKLTILSTTASQQELAQLTPLLENVSDKLEKKVLGHDEDFVTIEKNIYSVREYKQIDFVLPGQIGFSLLFSTLFGISMTFFNLREQLVLKRFYATPVNKLNILLGIGFSRLFFQLINVVVLIGVGHLALNFTLAHGLITFVDMLLMSIILLLLLMGVGLIFSSIAKSDTIIPLLINVFSLPQMLLSGTFFPVEVFPKWLQACCQILPLTQFNTAMRKISFEGVSIISCWQEIGILFIWIAVVYAVVVRVFKWE
ncbi:ABC transporter permease [Chitinophagaceae bacterium LWZ2-11]